jgi:hypothetical protein
MNHQTSWDLRRPTPAGSVALPLGNGTHAGTELDDQGRLTLAGSGTQGPIGRHDTRQTLSGQWTSAVLDRQAHGLAGAARANWLAQWLAPVHYTKHPGNPLFGPEQTAGKFGWVNGVAVIPIDGGKRYRMFFAGRKGEGIGMAEADASAPTVWRQHPGNPVLRPVADNWEGDAINQPRICKVTETHWRMYYTGWGLKGVQGSPWAMGLAETHDQGLTWTRVSPDPIMEREPSPSYDDGGVFVPHLVRFGDDWLSYYTAYQLTGPGQQSIHLCLARSSDGVKWSKFPGNPVFGDDFSDGAKRSVTSRCFVRLVDGVFQLWYTFGKPGYRIYYAESTDGIRFERYQPSAEAPTMLDAPNWIIPLSPKPHWDDDITCYPEVQVVGDEYRMWYCGNGFGTVGYASAKVGAKLAVSVRAGTSETPGATWSDWAALEAGAALPAGRFVQLRVALSRPNGETPSPRLTLPQLYPAG